MNITIGVTTKRINSTSQTMSGSVTLNCCLKEPTSLHDPIFMVQGLNSLSAYKYNYANWSDRYYWVDEIVAVTNDIAEVHCHLDPLATFKNAIGLSNALIKYGDYAYWNGYMDDDRFGPDRKVARTGSAVAPVGFDIGLSKGSWTVIMVIQDAYFGVTTYAMDLAQFSDVLNGFMNVVIGDVDSWFTLGTAWDNVVNGFKNLAMKILTGGQGALDNIRSCLMVPIPYSTFSGHPSAIAISSSPYNGNISLGPYQMLCVGNICVIPNNATVEHNLVLNLQRTLASTACHWLNSTKYRSIKVCHPGGLAEVNDNSMLDSAQIYFWSSLALCTGEYSIRVTSENSKDSDTIQVLTGCVGLDVMSVLVSSGNQGILAQATGAVQNMLTLGGNHGPSVISGSSPAGYATIGNMTPGNEVFIDIEYYCPVIFEANDTINYKAYCDSYGYPVGKYMQIGNNQGYVQCVNASVGNGTGGIAGATESDKSTINQYLNSGFYYE